MSKLSPARRQASAHDLALVRRVQGGDLEAFDELVERHEQHAFAVACRMLPGPEDARDVCQEAFLKAYRGIGAFKSDASFSTWLHRIVLNACASFHRARTAAKRGDGTISLHGGGGEDGPDLQVPGAGRGPEETVIGQETKLAVQEAIARLPEEFGEVLVLRELEGLSYEECAEALCIPTGTVRSRLHRARRELASQLRHLEPDPGGNGPVPLESKQAGSDRKTKDR